MFVVVVVVVERLKDTSDKNNSDVISQGLGKINPALLPLKLKMQQSGVT